MTPCSAPTRACSKSLPSSGLVFGFPAFTGLEPSSWKVSAVAGKVSAVAEKHCYSIFGAWCMSNLQRRGGRGGGYLSQNCCFVTVTLISTC